MVFRAELLAWGLRCVQDPRGVACFWCAQAKEVVAAQNEARRNAVLGLKDNLARVREEVRTKLAVWSAWGRRSAGRGERRGKEWRGVGSDWRPCWACKGQTRSTSGWAISHCLSLAVIAGYSVTVTVCTHASMHMSMLRGSLARVSHSSMVRGAVHPPLVLPFIEGSSPANSRSVHGYQPCEGCAQTNCLFLRWRLVDCF